MPRETGKQSQLWPRGTLLGEERRSAEGCGIRSSFPRASAASSSPVAVTEGTGLRASGCTGERLQTLPAALGPAPGVVTQGDTVTRSPGGTAKLEAPTSPPQMDFRAGTIHHSVFLHLFGVDLEVLLLLTTCSVLGRDEGGMKGWGGIHHLPRSISASIPQLHNPTGDKDEQPGHGG